MAKKFIERAIMDEFRHKVTAGKVLVLHGARRVGKTELIGRYLKEQSKKDYLLLNGEDQDTVDVMKKRTVENYRQLLDEKTLLVIDEAQKIPEVGKKLKLIVDSFENVSVIATGSSVFDLTNQMGEPLVGRMHPMHLYPLAQVEFSAQENLIETKSKLDERLIFGGYPELQHYKNQADKAEYLEEIVSSYLLRDILEFEGIRKADKIMDLLRLVAFQTGKEVSLDELANGLTGVSRSTVGKYLDLLTKVFVIYSVSGFSRNLRKEVTKSSRWYFRDNGIRNAIIRNFNPPDLRGDKGDLWENYLMAERIKYLDYTKRRVSHYFWRTYDQQEIDLVEEENTELRAYEFKYNPKKKPKVPGGWAHNYPEASFEVVNTDNYLDFIT